MARQLTKTPLAIDTRRAAEAHAGLRVIQSPDTTAVGRLIHCDVTVSVGRDPLGEQAARINDPLLSRAHARVVREGEQWWLLDSESTNGTWVDGRRSQRAALNDGTVVRIAQSLLLWECPAQNSAVGESTLLGASRTMHEIRYFIERVAGLDSPICIVGETGTGKELIARSLHQMSGRTGPFQVIHCAALSDGLLENVGEATLFFDELTDMSASLQAKLLHLIVAGEYTPIGGQEIETSSARLVVASGQDLQAAVAAGIIRRDLLARLSGLTLRIPPLRERRADILPLFQSFADKRGLPNERSVEFSERLLLHTWPMNGHELAGLVQHLAIFAGGRKLVAADVDDFAKTAEAEPESMTGRPSKEELLASLHRHGENIADVAREFGKDRRQVYRWLAAYDISLRRDKEK